MPEEAVGRIPERRSAARDGGLRDLPHAARRVYAPVRPGVFGAEAGARDDMAREIGTRVAVIGAGPAGLTALRKLATARVPAVGLEADPVHVGGISRTVRYKGFRFDIGGHRFFSKSRAIEDLWTEILPDEMLERSRSSRIFYGGQLYAYPLEAREALRKLGPVEAARCVLSYARARAFPAKPAANLEEWVSNAFGSRLFTIFFKAYTEKVWGMSCREISADWAAQRIKGLDLGTAIRNAVFPTRPAARDRAVKTLIDSFRYPRLGPGMLWDACAAQARAAGAELLMGCRVTGLSCAPDGRWTVTARAEDGTAVRVRAEHVVSSAPLREVALALEPALSPRARGAASALRYRDFVLVTLIVRDRGERRENWVYVHDPGIRAGRVQNFRAWSPELVPDPSLRSYGLEYFCFEGDALWTAPDPDLVALATGEIERLGMARASDVVDGCVVRQRKAYPVYDRGYAANLGILRAELAARYPTLHPVGRNGMHRYDNQDHAMMTAMLAVENIVAGRPRHDVWRVDEDAAYV
jgi:protoporphyrinogen oxidase